MAAASSQSVSASQPSLKNSGPPRKSKWELALERLSKDDREKFDIAETSKHDPHALLTDVLEAANQKKNDCLSKRWKLVINGRTIHLRDVLEKILCWVSKFMSIADIAIQYDPNGACLPWFAIRLIMQGAVHDIETLGYVLESLESVTNVIARCRVFEIRYLATQSLNISQRLAGSVILLYSDILRYLASVLRYYGSNTAIRFIRATSAKMSIEKKFKAIQSADTEVRRLADLAEAEKADEILNRVERLQDDQSTLSADIAANFDTLQTVLQELNEPFHRLSISLAEIQDGLKRETRRSILKAISRIPNGQHHSTARQNRLLGSGLWLLEKPAFRDWRQSSSSSVLWLHGIPGSGKTKLTSLVIDELRQTDHLAYFYCMRKAGEPLRAQCSPILASLVQQLATTGINSPILPPVVRQYQDAIDGFGEFEDQVWSMEESTRVLFELTDEYAAVTIVLDALDEVNQEDRQPLIDALSELVQESPNLVKVFISSRDSQDIVLSLEGCPNVYIDADDNAGDIAAFIDDRLDAAKLLRGKLSHSLRSEISETLFRGARGMFRWVDLQIQSLRPLKVAADIRTRLGTLPATLEESYWEIYQEILASGQHAAALAAFTFQWLLYAQDDIAIESFGVLAASVLSAGADDGFSSDEVLDVCANLVVKREKSFEFALLSVREFLEMLPKRHIDTLLHEKGNAALGEACLEYVVSGHKPATDLSRYAAFYWPHHISESKELRKTKPLADRIKSFLVDESQCKVAHTFDDWCKQVQSKFRKSSTSNRRLWDSTMVPANPVWITCLFDWVELVEFLYEKRYKGLEDPRRLTSLDPPNRFAYTYHRTSDSVTPLWYAISTNNKALVECIVRGGTGPRQQAFNWAGEYRTKAPLTEAAEENDLDLANLLLSQGNSEPDIEREAFMAAADRDNREMVKLFLRLTDVLRRSGYKALLGACRAGSADVVDILLAAGALTTVPHPAEHGAQLLRQAVLFSRFEVIQILLNEVHSQKMTLDHDALHEALLLSLLHNDTRYLETLRSLDPGLKVEHTSLFSLRTYSIIDPVMSGWAVNKGLTSDGENTRLLWTCGVEGWLHWFIEDALPMVHAWVADNGPYDALGRTMLHYAAEKGILWFVRSAMRNDLMRTQYYYSDTRGMTPLHLAARNGRGACVRLFMKHDVDIMARDAAGDMASDLAEREGHFAVADLIVVAMRRRLDLRLVPGRWLGPSTGLELVPYWLGIPWQPQLIPSDVVPVEVDYELRDGGRDWNLDIEDFDTDSEYEP